MNKIVIQVVALIFIVFVSIQLVGGLFNEFPYAGLAVGLLLLAAGTNYLINKFKK